MIWRRNPPLSRNMEEVWERQIWSRRSILNFLLKTHGSSLSDESLQTLLVEVETIINSRPLTTDVLNVTSLALLSPVNLLTMKSKVVMPLQVNSPHQIGTAENTGKSPTSVQQILEPMEKRGAESWKVEQTAKKLQGWRCCAIKRRLRMQSMANG